MELLDQCCDTNLEMGKVTQKNKKLVIIGAGEFGEIAYEYFTMDSVYEVIAFAVEKQFRDKDWMFDKPVVDFEDIQQIYPPTEYEVFVAVTYVKLNRVRRRLFVQCKEKGYHCASYISSRAFVWHNVNIGENVFIFENNTIQYYVEIGNNVILWSGNHIGHRTIIESDCWLTSHDVISGFCRIGSGSFIGVNATLGDNVILGKDTVFGAAAVTVKSLADEAGVYIGSPAKKIARTAYQQFHLEEEEI